VRILLTNDDGIHAPGLAALERIARALSDDVWICAPEYEQSGASRALTLADPIRVRKLGSPPLRRRGHAHRLRDDGRAAADRRRAPDLVLSGVNRGQNLAEDVTLSGTVAGAIEGMALGIRSIALSQAMNYLPRRGRRDIGRRRTLRPGIVQKLLETGWPPTWS
jgi:5'-nucleotidase